MRTKNQQEVSFNVTCLSAIMLKNKFRDNMFIKFVLLSTQSQHRSFNGMQSCWRLMNPFGSASWAYHVSEKKLEPRELIMVGHATAFKREDAARLELKRQEGLGGDIKPSLYVVSALTKKGAIEKVLDQIYMRVGHGVEKIF